MVVGWWPGHTHLAAGHSSFLAASHSGVASVRAEVTTLLAVLGQPFRLYAEQSYQLPRTHGSFRLQPGQLDAQRFRAIHRSLAKRR